MTSINPKNPSIASAAVTTSGVVPAGKTSGIGKASGPEINRAGEILGDLSSTNKAVTTQSGLFGLAATGAARDFDKPIAS